MLCETCGSTEHETANHPAEQQPDKIDRLLEAMEKMVNKPAAAPAPAPEPVAAPAPRAVGPTDAEIAAEFKRLIHAGESDKALMYVSQHAIGPQLAAMIEPVRISQGQQNLQTLRSRYGDKFTKRESAFRAKQREYGISDADLSNMKVAEDLCFVVFGADHETMNKESAEERLATARQEWEAEQARRTPASLGPSPKPFFPKKEEEDELNSHLDETIPREYVTRQLTRYRVPKERYLAQLRKANDPAATEAVGVGPFRKNNWTLIGDPPKEK